MILSCSASNEGNYRTAAYEAITSLVMHSTMDTIAVVQSVAVTILHRMEQLLSMQVSLSSCRRGFTADGQFTPESNIGCG